MDRDEEYYIQNIRRFAFPDDEEEEEMTYVQEEEE